MAVGGDHFERDAAEAQKAHRIGRVNKTVDECRLDLIEIGLRRRRRLLPGAMRRLPPLNERGRQLGRPLQFLTRFFVHFNARLLQYHPTSLFLQPVFSPVSVHSA
jgi:hypothetical protein